MKKITVYVYNNSFSIVDYWRTAIIIVLIFSYSYSLLYDDNADEAGNDARDAHDDIAGDVDNANDNAHDDTDDDNDNADITFTHYKPREERTCESLGFRKTECGSIRIGSGY